MEPTLGVVYRGRRTRSAIGLLNVAVYIHRGRSILKGDRLSRLPLRRRAILIELCQCVFFQKQLFGGQRPSLEDEAGKEKTYSVRHGRGSLSRVKLLRVCSR